MKQGLDSGMMTFEDSLLRRYRAGTITLDEALQNADSRTDLALRVRLWIDFLKHSYGDPRYWNR